MKNDIETIVDNEEFFHPLSDTDNVFVSHDHLKSEHQLPDKIIYIKDVKDNNKIVGSYYVAGRIVEDNKGYVFFMYGQPKRLDQAISPFSERKIKILKIYEGVSLDSFMEAEKIYRKTENLQSIEKFLENDAQEIEKLNNIKKNMIKHDKNSTRSRSDYP